MSITQSSPSRPAETRNFRRALTRWVLWSIVFLATVAVALTTLLHSRYFQDAARRRLISYLRHSTGLQVGISGLSVQWSRLGLDLQGVVIHGRESAAEPVLFSAQEIDLRWRLLSVWNLSADLARVRLYRPEIYIAVAKDGDSNLPPGPALDLLKFRIQHLDVLRGRLQWNEHRVPLDLAADDVLANLDRQAGAAGGYAARVALRNAVLSSTGGGPLPFQIDLKFRFDSTKLDVQSVDARTAESRLNARGELTNFSDPHIDFHYDTHLDAKELGKFLDISGAVGSVDWQGAGAYAAASSKLEGPAVLRFTSGGSKVLRGIPWSAHTFLRVERESPAAQGRISSDSQWTADFQKLEVSALGGQLNGAAAIAGDGADFSAKVKLQALNISLPVLGKKIVDETIGSRQIHWAGAISGPIEADYSSRGNQISIITDWQIAAPLVVPPGFTPVSGRLSGSYDSASQSVTVSQSFLKLPQSRLAADGTLGPRGAQMSFEADTTRFDELREAAEMIGQDTSKIPLEVFGTARAKLELAGSLQRPTITGDVAVNDFSFRNARWDAISGDVQYHSQSSAEPSALVHRNSGMLQGPAHIRISSGKLVRGNAEALFDGEADLVDGAITQESEVAGNLTIRNGDVMELQQMAGTHYPVQGTLEGSAKASGTLHELRLQGNLAATRGAIYGEAFDRLGMQWSLQADGRLSAEQIVLQRGDATLHGAAELGLRTRAYKFSITAANVPLESISYLRNHNVPVSGLAQLKAEGSGTFDQPQIQGRIDIPALHLLRSGADSGDQGDQGSLTLDVETHGDRAVLQIQAGFPQADLKGSGEVVLHSPFPASSQLSYDNLNLPMALRPIRQFPDTVQGHARGSVAIRGELLNSSKMSVVASIESLNASVGSVAIRNSDAFQVRFQNKLLQIDQVRLTGQNVDVQVGGAIQLAADPALSITAKGQVDLAGVRAFVPQLSASGQAQLDARIGGTVRKPAWLGRISFADAGAQYGDLPNGLNKITGALIFEGNRGSFENFTAETGGGKVKLGGFVAYGADSQWHVQATAHLDGVRLRYPAQINTWVSGDLAVIGTPDSSLVSGRLVIDRAVISAELDAAPMLFNTRGQGMAISGSPLLAGMRLDVAIVSGPEMRMETSMAKNLQTDINLRIQGTPLQLGLLGRIGTSQGEVYVNGRQFSIERGEVTFSNPFQLEPTMNLTLHSQIQQYDITLDLAGPPDRLIVNYRSDPPLPPADIISLLVGSNPSQLSLAPSTAGSEPQLGANTALSQALGGQIGSRLDRIFGAGRVQINPQMAGGGQSAGVTVAISQQIRNNVNFIYATNVANAQEQIIQAEWAISSRFSVVAIRDQNGLIGVNFDIKLRFR